MNLNLKNFEKHISSKILERGKEYFDNDRIEIPEKIAPGKWLTRAFGQKTYYVEVRTHRSVIKGWDCDCPYDHGPICKHVAASFYAIAEQLYRKTSSDSKKPKENQIKTILQKTNKKELEGFLTLNFKNNSSLKNNFLAHFADYLSDNTEKKYSIKIASIINSAQTNEDYYTYYKSSIFYKPLVKLLKRSRKLIQEKNLTEALIISKTMLKLVPKISNLTDDESESILFILEETSEILADIAHVAPPMMKDEIFDYCSTEYSKAKYQPLSINDYFVDLAQNLVSTKEQEIIFIKILNKEIAKAKKESQFDYNEISLIEKKINFLKQLNRKDEVHKILNENIDKLHFRRIVIKDYLKEKNITHAKKLIYEGLEIKTILSQDKKILYDFLLSIAIDEKKTKDIRNFSEILFLDFGKDFKYYRILKSTYSNKDWITKCESIINSLRKGRNNFNFLEFRTILNIYVEESYLSRLLKNLQKNKNQITLVNEYAGYLTEKYPNEILDIYDSAVKTLAVDTGRDIYYTISDYLKDMLKIKGGEKKVKKIINEFKKQYKIRRVMIKILNEDFPQFNTPNKTKDNNSDLTLF